MRETANSRPKSRGILKNWYPGAGFDYGFVTLTESGQPDLAPIGTDVFIILGDRLGNCMLELKNGETIVEINGLAPPRSLVMYPKDRCPRGRSWRVVSPVADCA